MGGSKGMNPVKDTLFGKKDKGVASSYMKLEKEQKDILSRYKGMLGTNTDQIARNTVAAQEKSLLAGAKDNERNASQLVAQRGLGNSSVGLNAILNANRGLDEKVGSVRAQLPGMMYNLKNQNLNTAAGGIQNILNNRTFIQGRESTGRGGGLVGLGMTAAGAYFGGPGGAQAGHAAGKSIANL